jgi:hypothetical protein
VSSDGFDVRLNALVDGELASADAADLMAQVAADPDLRQRLGQITLTKAMVRQAYAGVVPPPAVQARPAGRGPRFALAALALVVVAAAGGWWARGDLSAPPERPLAIDGAARPGAATGHVILHIGSAAPGDGLAVLERAEGLVAAARDAGGAVSIEIVANGPGLDLLRTAVSPHAQRIEALRRSYPALTLVACGQTVQKLRDAGADTRLLPGTVLATSALDQIVLRLQQGWVYVRV